MPHDGAPPARVQVRSALAGPALAQSPPVPSEEELDELTYVAVALAEEAGTFIVDQRPAELGVATTKSSVTDVVTVMDQACERLLRQRIAELRPGDAFLGEEAGASPGTTGITWVVDPIDGTVNYLYDIPYYCVSVSAVVGDAAVPGAWRPVVGAVCNPMSDEVFSARLGSGAYLATGERARRGPARHRLRVSDVSVLDRALTGTGFGYVAADRARQGAAAATLLPEIRDLRRTGSAALDLCSVAAGRLDAYFEAGLNPWDLAAGWIVATEAGAVLSGLFGSAPGAEMTIASGPALHHELVARIEQLHPVAGR